KELPSPQLIVADAQGVRLPAELWSIDAGILEDASKSQDPAELAAAAKLFGGEFLAGLNINEEGFDEWLNTQRQRTQRAAARLCETFVGRPDLVLDGEQAIALAEHLLALDPLRENSQRMALTLYARYRGKNEALTQAASFTALLQRELGVAP